MTILTNKPKDISDGWHTNDKDIDQNKQDQGNGHMSWPAEGLAWKEQLLKGSADLQPTKGKTGQDLHVVPLSLSLPCPRSLIPYPTFCTSSLSMPLP